MEIVAESRDGSQRTLQSRGRSPGAFESPGQRRRNGAASSRAIQRDPGVDRVRSSQATGSSAVDRTILSLPTPTSGSSDGPIAGVRSTRSVRVQFRLFAGTPDHRLNRSSSRIFACRKNTPPIFGSTDLAFTKSRTTVFGT